VDLAGTPSFRELLQRVRKTALDAYSHQDVPFDKVVEFLKPERRLDETPFFSVMFQLDEIEPAQRAVDSVTVEPFEVITQSAKFDLLMMIKASGKTYEATLEYRSDLFSQHSIRSMLNLFCSVLEYAVKDPDASVLACLQPASTQLERLKLEFASNTFPS
jgi:non-ribosomal peptide synthetase component F